MPAENRNPFPGNASLPYATNETARHDRLNLAANFKRRRTLLGRVRWGWLAGVLVCAIAAFSQFDQGRDSREGWATVLTWLGIGYLLITAMAAAPSWPVVLALLVLELLMAPLEYVIVSHAAGIPHGPHGFLSFADFAATCFLFAGFAFLWAFLSRRSCRLLKLAQDD